jgi:puromycin-sensitive aminopeptidase
VTTAVTTPPLDPYRLPRTVAPSRYEIELEPDLARASFHGSVHVVVTAAEAVPELVLNAAELTIHACRIDGIDAVWRLDDEAERLFVAPVEGAVPAGDHVVDVEFDGVLNDMLRGWYRSTFKAPAADGGDDVEHVIATTQMQSTDCRRAFPCWDEPDFKAVFAITLVIDEGLLAVSNGREVAREPRHDGKIAVTFADTMVMSSYLVAFVVGPLTATEWVDVDGIPLRLVHVPGKEGLTEFGLEIGAFALRWFQEYYGIDYPSDKVELLALPDFAAGAMENLGCITFRESLLLVDPATATQAERQVVADVVAHELAHMWFGDLVTMGWWNGIWLNEAFATFMEIACCDAFRPEWQRWTTFGLERSAAFETDSLSSTRAVEFAVHSPADAEGMFDVLTYEKGGALLRMLEQHLGPERFQVGVSHYLRTHSYANTETSDLWDAIEHTSGEPVRRIMDSWIWQPGYPLVSVGLTADGTQIVLSQRRFAFDPEAVDATTWAVPVAVRTEAGTRSYLLDNPEMRIPYDGGAVVVNAGGHGFYRVDYGEPLRAELTAEFVAGLSTLERYNLVDDAWNAVVAGALSAIEYLALVERLADEREFGVWQSIAIGLRGVRRLVGDDDAAAVAGFQALVRALAGPALAELGEPAEGESDLTAKLRGLLLGLLAVQGADVAARARALGYYAAWEADASSVDAELAAAATTVLAATGGEAEYERMLDRALNGATPQEQLRHLYALAEFDSAALMQRTCELAFGDQVKTQNAPFLLRLCIANRLHGAAAWTFVRRHWSEANERFPRNTIVRMVDAVRLLDRPEQVADSAAFFSEHPIEQAVKTLEQILERQRVNADVRVRNEAELLSHLARAD